MVLKERRGRRSAINLLRAHKKRRRDRWFLGLLVLASLLVMGYSAFQTMRPKLHAVTTPVTHAAKPPQWPATVAASSEARRKCDDLRVLVDQRHTLSSDYVPKDLVSLHDYGVPILGSEALHLRREAAENLGRLVEDAAAYGEELVVASAYRSYRDQRTSHSRLASVYGAEAAGMSATPGHSQHQLGTAVDFTNAAASYQVWLPFGETSASLWLEHNAWKYGFILAYPSGKEDETGYQWEPWHYRYVGVENARRIVESGVSLQKFLEREGVTPRC
ncbi:MAG TPA: M15 family metallopeptidase [Rubrobacteraceae bacterium]|nr:M15 family metallopeptidase [Rubrobacteraceae bacterium]